MTLAVCAVLICKLPTQTTLACSPQPTERTITLLSASLRKAVVVGDFNVQQLEIPNLLVQRALQDAVRRTLSHTVDNLRPAVQEASQVVRRLAYELQMNKICKVGDAHGRMLHLRMNVNHAKDFAAVRQAEQLIERVPSVLLKLGAELPR